VDASAADAVTFGHDHGVPLVHALQQSMEAKALCRWHGAGNQLFNEPFRGNVIAGPQDLLAQVLRELLDRRNTGVGENALVGGRAAVGSDVGLVVCVENT
jgi:hypothetical protein